MKKLSPSEINLTDVTQLVNEQAKRWDPNLPDFRILMFV